MKYGIGLKLGLLLATFGLVAMGTVGYYSYASSRTALLAASQRDLLTATQVLGRSFQGSIDEIATDTSLLARLPASSVLANAPAGARSERDKQLVADVFASMLAVHPEYYQIRLIDADHHGLELIRVDRDGDKLSRVPEVDLQEKAHYPYVFNTLLLSAGQVYLSDIGINHEEGAHSGLGKPTVRVATPVVSGDGKVVGLVVISLDLNSLFARLKTDLPKPYQLYLSNHWGDYLIHPDPAEAFGFDQGRRVFIQDSFESVASLVKGTSDSVVTNMESPQHAPKGLVAAFVRLPFGGSSESKFVILGLSQPLEAVVRETKRLGWNTLQMILVLGALAVGLAALVSRAVTGPLRAMADAMKLFSKDQTVSELPSARRDEIGLLARSLNEMQTAMVRNMRELNESRQSLKHLAQHDTLTGLPNRALFDDRLGQAVSQARRDQTRIALLFVDLDGFKDINDTYGHHAGDLLLTAAAKRMEACVRDADTVGRLGGDEFVVLLTYVEADQDALLVAQKICNTLGRPFEVDSLLLDISASIGIAIYPDHGDDELSLSRSADAAMYIAKKKGGDCAWIFGH
ncbi:GGDEF domain-containing protein [Rhodoferax sp.]|uniref:putative bifunctional diguanylate cyclase/phosphodiesterase n=1 Tax=Rhodoferax sp. TaxID=50421 RepID=UPI001EB6E55A|nr:GGDEF domain-containing protein [Rhodoferax sp.]MBT9506138.1 GGDEF domain-containing protein [Rhodoferax sp.]